MYVVREETGWRRVQSYRNSSFDDKVQMPPQEVWDKKSTGLVTCGLIGKRKKKSNSVGEISSFISKICDKRKKMSVSVGLNTEFTHLKSHLGSEN